MKISNRLFKIYLGALAITSFALNAIDNPHFWRATNFIPEFYEPGLPEIGSHHLILPWDLAQPKPAEMAKVKRSHCWIFMASIICKHLALMFRVKI